MLRHLAKRPVQQCGLTCEGLHQQDRGYLHLATTDDQAGVLGVLPAPFQRTKVRQPYVSVWMSADDQFLQFLGLYVLLLVFLLFGWTADTVAGFLSLQRSHRLDDVA